ncbi:MAG TPA: tetratricopeptide repeat protein, partial [Acidimicrobiia bacterium]|nr:tetratricopeptide repeat protein [Acidimicrobiia bacterium]
MGQLPEGTVTFLFSDIEGSTRMARDLGDAWPTVLEQHRALLRKAFATHSGHEVSTEGDGFFVAFERASDAVAAAIDAQRALRRHDWGDRPALHVRMGIHTGAAELVDDDYVGVTVHEAARVASAAHGGQIVISAATRQLCSDVDGSTTVDLGLHNLKDLPTPVRLHQVCHPGLPERFPSLRTSAETPHNLPVRLTSLVGRDEELRVVEKLVGDHRLVTLAGAGGAGKTRLAVEVASRLLSSFPDGVWFVELATVRESALVPQAVADVLGIRVVEDSRDLATLIPAFLEDRRSLLVLDNCEHVIVAAAELADRVMRGTPATHILATSREALSVEGEHARRVPSLDLPGDGVDPLESSAVRLFFDRAEAGDAMVDPSPENLDAAVQICERLDGMPLAIELAAARARSLTPVQIAERLDDRFRLLTGGSRTALPRQQTLGAMIDWSHDLLNEDECTLFRRLAVFSGGFTLEAAEDVCAGGRLPEGAVLDLLDDLVAKSLVVPPTATPARYRYLETIRQYARQKLLEASEIEALRDAHLRWFLDFAETAAPRLREADQAVWLDAVAAEHDNLRGALEWAVDAPHRGDAAPRLVSALWLFWWIRGHWQEGRTWAEQALAVSPSEDPLLRAHALWAMGFFARFLGDTERAEAPLGEAFAIWEQHGDRAGLARCYYALGHCAATALHVDQARDHYRNGARLARDVGDYLTLGWCLLLDGALPGTPPPEREALFLEALAIARQNGDLWNTAMALNNLGAVAAARNDHGRASTLLRESLAIARE